MTHRGTEPAERAAHAARRARRAAGRGGDGVGHGRGDGRGPRQVRPDPLRCAAGQPVDYRTYEGRDHVGLVQADSPLAPDLVRWTEARLAGEPPTPTCATG
ncbi:hypothetical protein [Cellulosimicrobium cellulans]|uniref:hypothetical protein n=1 Tax=Cellulosimicrobium cellulans TaxID=1710 RepID=UPI001BA49551|nr:hypothetical protein [Cellulosimicrobium cellulans]QUB99149.1 hypothetical protein J5A69_15695 [Cellulosimicrobium cellulans]